MTLAGILLILILGLYGVANIGILFQYFRSCAKIKDFSIGFSITLLAFGVPFMLTAMLTEKRRLLKKNKNF